MPITIEDQFKFLISCIRWSDHGKVNFDAVASECKIVSKAAAAKRYERLMKTHGISFTGSSVRQPRARPIKSEYRNRAAAPAKKKNSKDNSTFDDGSYGDEEAMNSELGNGDLNEEFVVKEEAYDDEPSTEKSINQTQYHNDYNGHSQMGGEMSQNYAGDSIYGGNSSGYATPMGYALGSHDQQDGDYFDPEE